MTGKGSCLTIDCVFVFMKATMWSGVAVLVACTTTRGNDHRGGLEGDLACPNTFFSYYSGVKGELRAAAESESEEDEDEEDEDEDEDEDEEDDDDDDDEDDGEESSVTILIHLLLLL